MINISNTIKQACNSDKMTYREYVVLSGTTAQIDVVTEMYASAYKDTHFIGTFNMKYIKFTTSNDVKYRNKELTLYKEVNGESFKVGNFIVTEINDNDSNEEVTVTAYDYGLKFAQPYETSLDYEGGNVTLKDVLDEICENVGVELVNSTITNGDFIVDSNQFVNGEMYGDVVSAVAYLSGDFATINEDDKLELVFNVTESQKEEGSSLSLSNTINARVKNFKIYGYTKQEGTPTPDAPIEVEVGTGKNLLSEKTETANNTYFYKDNGFKVKAGTTYTLSCDTVATGLYVRKQDNTALFSAYSKTILTFTPTEDTFVFFDFYYTSDKSTKYQLEKGSVATSYLPYNTIENKSNGKNLLNLEEFKTQTTNGITATKNGNGTITLNGTSTGPIFLNLNSAKSLIPIKQGDIISIGVNNVLPTSPTGMYVELRRYGGVGNSFVITRGQSEKVNQIANYTDECFMHVYIPSGMVLDNFVIFPMVVKASSLGDYEPYKESSIQHHLGDNFLADKDYIENGVLNKNIRHLRLAIADMNNIEDYPGWNGITQINKDFPEQNTNLINVTKSIYCNIIKNNRGFGINTMNGGATIWLQKGHFGLTQTQWKEQYPDLVVDVYYELAETEQIPLETTGELRTFEPNTIITNDLNSEMEIEYGVINEIIEDYVDLQDKRDTRPITSLSIGTSQVQGQNAVIKDETLIEKYGEHWLEINDVPFAYTLEKREQLKKAIFDKVKGFGYSSFKSEYAFKPYYSLGDLVYFKNKDGKLINSIILKFTSKYDNIILEAPSVTDATVEYQNPKSAYDVAKRAEVIANQNTAEITSLTTQTSQLRDDVSNNYYTIEQTNQMIQNAETGVTNTFSEAGGNNEIRNSAIWFKNSGEDAETNPYEFWEGKANEGSNDKATNYRSILLGKGSFIHDDIEVPNGNYSISFYYRKLITSAIASVVINGKEYPLDSLETKQFYTGEQDSETGEYIVDPIVVSNNHIKIEFKCDALDGVEVYDLMCNKGSVKLAYSQNQNETTTSTVNISKGITITSSLEKNTKFKADYDGIRILDGANNSKTEFTDKGAETDELIVRKKATITGLLHQEVDDQTWVTKI